MNQKKIGCDNMVSLNNTLGTCWNLSILTILFYSDETGPEVQTKLTLPSYLSAMEHATNLVNEAEQQLRELIPSYINFDVKKKDIIILIKHVIERFNTKINITEILASDRPKYLDEHLPNVSMKEIGLQRQISGECEEQLTRYFFNIFDKEIVTEDDYGGDYYDKYLLLNLLSIILLHKKIYIRNLIEYTDEFEYTDLNKPSLGFMIGNGKHAVGLFKCNNNYKFVDNQNIINFKFNELLAIIKCLNETDKPYLFLLDSNGLYIQGDDTQYRFNDKYRDDKDPLFESTKLSNFHILSFHEEIESERDCEIMRMDGEASVWYGVLERMLERQDLEQFEISIKDVKDINKLDYMFRKLLKDYEKNKDFIMILMKYGFNKKLYIKKTFYSPLEFASKKGYSDLVKFILENKLGEAYFNKKNKEDITALQSALKLALKNKEDIKELYSALKLAKDKYEETKVKSNMELTSALILAILNKKLEVIKILLEGGVDPNTGNIYYSWDNDKNYEYVKPLILASNLDINIVDLLLDKGAEINDTDSDGNSALHHAIKSKKLDIVKRLIRKGANINSQNMNGKTPLILAYHYINYEAIVELLNAGADTNISDTSGRSFVDYIRNPRPAGPSSTPELQRRRRELRERVLKLIDPPLDGKTKYLKNDSFYKKYLKYKQKYLSLKKIM